MTAVEVADVCRRRVNATDEASSLKSEGEMSVMEAMVKQLRSYAKEVEILRRDRTALANEVRENMGKNGREQKAKQMVSTQPDEVIEKAMEIIGEVWYEMKWLERAGALFVIPKLLKANSVRDNKNKSIDKLDDEITRLKGELTATENLAAARLPQIEAEKKRSEELESVISVLKKELQTQTELVRTPTAHPSDHNIGIPEGLFGLQVLVKAVQEESSIELLPPQSSTTPRTPVGRTEVDDSTLQQLRQEIEVLSQENLELSRDVSDLTSVNTGVTEPTQKLVARTRLLKKDLRREKKQRLEAQTLLDSVRDKCVSFYEKQKGKRRDVQSAFKTEKSLRESQDAELKVWVPSYSVVIPHFGDKKQTKPNKTKTNQTKTDTERSKGCNGCGNSVLWPSARR